MSEIEILVQENKELKEKLLALIEATEDKNGQFSAWHRELRRTVKEAKQTLKIEI